MSDNWLSFFYQCYLKLGRPGSFKGSAADDPLQARTAAQAIGSGSLLRSGRGLRLGLGAVTRAAPGSVKNRGAAQVQRAAPVLSQPVQPISPAASQKAQDTGKAKKNWHIFFAAITRKTTIMPDGDGCFSVSACVTLYSSSLRMTHQRLQLYCLLLLLSNKQLWDCFLLKSAWDEGISLKCICWDEFWWIWLDGF